MKIFNSLFQKGERFPKSQYDTIIIQRGDDVSPIVGGVDFSYRNYQFCAEVPYLVVITLVIQEDNGAGFPTADEGKVLDQFEDVLINKLKSLARIHWVGRLTYDGRRDLLFYTDKLDPIHEYLQDIINRQDHLRPFEYTIQEDAEWCSIRKILSAELKNDEASSN